MGKVCKRMQEPQKCVQTHYTEFLHREPSAMAEIKPERGMKNVTISVAETVANWARLEAARRNTSVSKMVGEMLAEKMRHDDAYERAMNEVLKFESFGSSTGPYLTRDEIYDRSVKW